MTLDISAHTVEDDGALGEWVEIDLPTRRGMGLESWRDVVYGRLDAWGARILPQLAEMDIMVAGLELEALAHEIENLFNLLDDDETLEAARSRLGYGLEVIRWAQARGLGIWLG